VRRIAEAAIEVADTQGLDALSMRRVAEQLGVGTMSLYTYVPGKAELIDVMLDAVHGEADGATAPEGGWREKLEHVARANWDLARRHPWILQVATAARPPLGPGSIAKYERELAAVADSGLDDVEMDAVITLINQYVHSAARGAADAADIERSSGMDDQAWWAAAAPWLEKVFDPGRYPVASRVGSAAGEFHNAAYDPQYAFEFGLQRILDGIEALVQRRGSS
jgi:AcrR family transcriptional regulator